MLATRKTRKAQKEYHRRMRVGCRRVGLVRGSHSRRGSSRRCYPAFAVLASPAHSSRHCHLRQYEALSNSLPWGLVLAYHGSRGESCLCKHGANVLAHFGDLTMRTFDWRIEQKEQLP